MDEPDCGGFPSAIQNGPGGESRGAGITREAPTRPIPQAGSGAQRPRFPTGAGGLARAATVGAWTTRPNAPLPRRVVAPRGRARPFLCSWVTGPPTALVCLFFDHDRMVLSSRVDWPPARWRPARSSRPWQREPATAAPARCSSQRWKPGVRTKGDSHRPVVALRGGGGWRCQWAGRSADGALARAGMSSECPEHLLDPHSPAVVQLIAQGWSAAPTATVSSQRWHPAIKCRTWDHRLRRVPQREQGQAIHDASRLLQSDRPLAAADVSLIAQVCRDIRTRDVVLATGMYRGSGGERRWQGVRHRAASGPRRQHRAGHDRGGADRLQLGEGTRATATICIGKPPIDPRSVRTSVQQSCAADRLAAVHVPPGRRDMSVSELTTTTTSTRSRRRCGRRLRYRQVMSLSVKPGPS